jgi:hypothetical protein
VLECGTIRNPDPIMWGIYPIFKFVVRLDIVISSQVLFHDGSLLHSELNTQLLITVHNSSRNLTQL